jgi:hypothetical protein
VVFEPPRLATILTSPRLLFYGFFGNYFPSRSHMRVAFRKPAPLRSELDARARG